jgi:negative regulator of flagellin synthesis FlgM
MRITTKATGTAAYAQALSGAQSLQSTQLARGTDKNRETNGAFDQVDISQESSGASRFQKELAARLVQEIRTSTSTADIQQVRDQIQSGTYRLNSESIASAMLLGG